MILSLILMFAVSALAPFIIEKVFTPKGKINYYLPAAAAGALVGLDYGFWGVILVGLAGGLGGLLYQMTVRW